MEKLKSNMINDILIFIFFLLAPVSCNTPAVKKEEKANDSFGLTFPEKEEDNEKTFYTACWLIDIIFTLNFILPLSSR